MLIVTSYETSRCISNPGPYGPRVLMYDVRDRVAHEREPMAPAPEKPRRSDGKRTRAAIPDGTPTSCGTRRVAYAFTYADRAGAYQSGVWLSLECACGRTQTMRVKVWRDSCRLNQSGCRKCSERAVRRGEFMTCPR